jgi:mannose-6-phosphate isomerase-like protein (cupin superfamily)
MEEPEMKVRRIVTGHRGGKSVVISDGQTRKARDYVNVPGQASALLWATRAQPSVPHDGADPISEESLYVPPPGETRLMLVTFPPDSVMMSSSFNPAAAGQEYMEHMPELAKTFEPDNPGMHTTDTVDYGIVLEGEVWLELDDGEQVHLKAHDVVVQNGTRHAWRNKSDKPVKIAFTIVGARRIA